MECSLTDISSSDSSVVVLDENEFEEYCVETAKQNHKNNKTQTATIYSDVQIDVNTSLVDLCTVLQPAKYSFCQSKEDGKSVVISVPITREANDYRNFRFAESKKDELFPFDYNLTPSCNDVDVNFYFIKHQSIFDAAKWKQIFQRHLKCLNVLAIGVLHMKLQGDKLMKFISTHFRKVASVYLNLIQDEKYGGFSKTTIFRARSMYAMARILCTTFFARQSESFQR